MKEYEVGYKKPPRNTKFMPGFSGNPNGRPKGSKNIRTILQEELNSKVTVTEQGRRYELTKQEALIKSLFASALANDAKARAVLLGLILKITDTEANREPVIYSENQNDNIILDRFIKRFKDKNVSE